jgi:hypothetical protein
VGASRSQPRTWRFGTGAHGGCPKARRPSPVGVGTRARLAATSVALSTAMPGRAVLDLNGLEADNFLAFVALRALDTAQPAWAARVSWHQPAWTARLHLAASVDEAGLAQGGRSGSIRPCWSCSSTRAWRRWRRGGWIADVHARRASTGRRPSTLATGHRLHDRPKRPPTAGHGSDGLEAPSQRVRRRE